MTIDELVKLLDDYVKWMCPLSDVDEAYRQALIDVGTLVQDKEFAESIRKLIYDQSLRH